MRITELLAIALSQVATVTCSVLGQVETRSIASQRPNYAISPRHPGKAFPLSPARTKTCIVKSNGNGKDDSQNILGAIKECNNGGHVLFPKTSSYTIGTALDLTFLEHIDLGIKFYATASVNSKLTAI